MSSAGSAQSINSKNKKEKAVAFLFEVDEFDDVEEVVVDLDSGEVGFVPLESVPLLQELEIDLSLMYQSILWMLLTPLTKMAGRPLGRHPLYKSVIASQRHNCNSSTSNGSNTANNGSGNKHRKEANIDFWGPCLVVGLYCLVLWLSKVHNTSWVFMIWGTAGVFNHLVGRVYSKVFYYNLKAKVLALPYSTLATQSLHNRYTIATQPLRNHCIIAAQSLNNLYTTAAQSLRYRSTLARSQH
jgi:hypothetical protein